MAKSCFIISSIGKEGSEIREIADEKYELVFEPILNEIKFSVTRSDKVATPGSISREIVQNLIDADLVIADVTDENPNVFYELAIRNAIKKPVIIFQRPDQTLPFDIYDKRAISIDRENPRIWEDAKAQLRAQIKMAENNPDQASESILSDFAFEIGKGEGRTDTQRIFSLLKDIKQDLRKRPKDGDLPKEKIFKDFAKIYDELKVVGAHHVSIPKGTGVPGCEEKNECFIPCEVKIHAGETVEWSNDDTAAHTVTSGTAEDGPDGNFDSGLFKANSKFHFSFDNFAPGEYSYFCMVHPWQTGKIIVES